MNTQLNAIRTKSVLSFAIAIAISCAVTLSSTSFAGDKEPCAAKASASVKKLDAPATAPSQGPDSNAGSAQNKGKK